VGPKAGLDVCEKSRSHRDFFLPYFVRVVYFVSLVLFWYLDEGLRAVEFSIMKNPTASVGSEPAISGSRGQHANL
jgi:hypothetical protein